MEKDKDRKSASKLPIPVRISEQVWDDEAPPFLSICCITYNHSKFINKSIDSFLMQETSFPVEIIIRDDASTDGTQNIIKDYAKKYPHLIKTILHSENQFKKSKRAFPETYSVARGYYIALCEGDDCWTDISKLQKQVYLLQQNPTASFCFPRSDLDSLLAQAENPLRHVRRSERRH